MTAWHQVQLLAWDVFAFTSCPCPRKQLLFPRQQPLCPPLPALLRVKFSSWPLSPRQQPLFPPLPATLCVVCEVFRRLWTPLLVSLFLLPIHFLPKMTAHSLCKFGYLCQALETLDSHGLLTVTYPVVCPFTWQLPTLLYVHSLCYCPDPVVCVYILFGVCRHFPLQKGLFWLENKCWPNWSTGSIKEQHLTRKGRWLWMHKCLFGETTLPWGSWEEGVCKGGIRAYAVISLWLRACAVISLWYELSSSQWLQFLLGKLLAWPASIGVTSFPLLR